jgi:TfoX N-terminal domain
VNSADVKYRESLFWELAQQLLAEPGVTQGTMMGYPCLRSDGTFFACVERATGHLIVKLPAHRVSELAAAGQALPFTPNGRTFREWAAFPVADPAEWRALLAEARGFVAG